MPAHDAECFPQRRPGQGIPARDPFCVPEFLQRETEPQGLKQLQWPRNLFGELASIAGLMEPGAEAE